MVIDDEPLRFWSHDARRRDEFTLDIEVNKWRERIGTEMMFAERSRQMQEDKMTPEERAEAERIAREPPPHRWTHGPKYLFDLGKEVTGGTTPYEMKDARDTWFSMQRVKQMAVPHFTLRPFYIVLYYSVIWKPCVTDIFIHF